MKNYEKYFNSMFKVLDISQSSLNDITGISLSIIKNISAGRRKLTDDDIKILDKIMYKISGEVFDSFEEYAEFMHDQEDKSMGQWLQTELEEVDENTFIYLFYTIVNKNIYLVDLAYQYEIEDENDEDTQELISEYPYIITRLKDAYDLAKTLCDYIDGSGDENTSK